MGSRVRDQTTLDDEEVDARHMPSDFFPNITRELRRSASNQDPHPDLNRSSKRNSHSLVSNFRGLEEMAASCRVRAKLSATVGQP